MSEVLVPAFLLATLVAIGFVIFSVVDGETAFSRKCDELGGFRVYSKCIIVPGVKVVSP